MKYLKLINAAICIATVFILMSLTGKSKYISGVIAAEDITGLAETIPVRFWELPQLFFYVLFAYFLVSAFKNKNKVKLLIDTIIVLLMTGFSFYLYFLALKLPAKPNSVFNVALENYINSSMMMLVITLLFVAITFLNYKYGKNNSFIH